MSDFTNIGIITGIYRVTLVDAEPILVKVIGADIMRWEQVNNKSFFEGALGYSRMAWVVWAAMTRGKLTELKLPEFLPVVEEIERQDEEPEKSGEAEDEGVPLPDPTEAAGTAW